MSTIAICLLCDGSSDFCIEDIIQWIIDTSAPQIYYRTVRATDLVPASGSLESRISRANSLYSPDVIVCHRDAESHGLDRRVKEVIDSHARSGISTPVIPAIPIRMLESWLLADEAAIRKAADNANGSTPLDLPSHGKIESLQNPKASLFEALRTASGLGSQRLRRFNEQRARSRVTGFIEDYSALRHQKGFKRFESDLLASIQGIRDQA